MKILSAIVGLAMVIASYIVSISDLERGMKILLLNMIISFLLFIGITIEYLLERNKKIISLRMKIIFTFVLYGLINYFTNLHLRMLFSIIIFIAIVFIFKKLQQME